MAAMAEARQAGSLWTAEEDVLLLRHVAKYGTKHWGYLQTSGTLPHRDQKACCNRFILLKRKFFQARSRGQRLTFPVNPPPHSSPSSHPSSPTCSPPPSSSAAAGSAGASAAAAAATAVSAVVPPRRASSGSPLGVARSSSPSCGLGVGVGLHGRSVPSFKPTFKHRGVADGGSAEVALRGALSAASTRSMEHPTAKANNSDFNDASFDGGSFAGGYALVGDALEAAMTSADTDDDGDCGGAKQLQLSSQQQPLPWGPSRSLEASSCGDDLPPLMAEATAATVSAAVVTSAMAGAVQVGGGAARAAAPAPLVRSSSLQPQRQQKQQQHLLHLLWQQQALLARTGSSNASSDFNSPAAFVPSLSSRSSGNFAADLGLLAAGGQGDSAAPAPPSSLAAVSDAVVPDLLRPSPLSAQGPAAAAAAATAAAKASAALVGGGSPVRCWGSGAATTDSVASGFIHAAATGGLQSLYLCSSGPPSVGAQLPDVKPKLLHAPSPWTLSQTSSSAAAGEVGCSTAASAAGSDAVPPCVLAGARAPAPAYPQMDPSRSMSPDACLEQFSSAPGQMLFGSDSFRLAGYGAPNLGFGSGDCSIPLAGATSAASLEPSAVAADWPGKGVLEQLLMADDDFMMGGMGEEAAVKAELTAASSAGAGSASAAALALGGPSMIAGLAVENCNELWEILRDVSSVLAPATCPQ